MRKSNMHDHPSGRKHRPQAPRAQVNANLVERIAVAQERTAAALEELAVLGRAERAGPAARSLAGLVARIEDEVQEQALEPELRVIR